MSLESASEPFIKQSLEQFLIVLAVSLSVATASRIFSWLRQIPYTLLLVIVGLGLAFLNIPLVKLSPELILEIFLPPLLFEAAWNCPWKGLKADFLPIFLFAVVGVVIAVFGVALPLHQFTSLSLITCLLIGASLSATDPVSVIAVFKELGVPKRLLVLTEGESLFNDGVAVVAFVILVSIPLGNKELSAVSVIIDVLKFAGLGIAAGCLVGFGISYLTQRVDIPLVEQSLTLMAAYGSYIIAENVGGSGVIASVVVGLVLGNFGSKIGMSPRTRLTVTEFWEFLAFFVNSIVFLLIGTQINITELIGDLDLIVITIAAVVLGRLLIILGLANLSNLFASNPINIKEQTILWWGGLRGSISIALALSIPVILPDRQHLINVVFGVVLFTLLVQGLSINWLLNKLGLIGDQPLRQSFMELVARQSALKKMLDFLDKTKIAPDSDKSLISQEQQLIAGKLKTVEEEMQKLNIDNPELRPFLTRELRKTLLDIEAETYAQFISAGKLTKNPSTIMQEIMLEND
ncbi:MAG: Na(+)/H(+) antiporter ApNhaP [Chroococcopsis gigantea SAG 12.99]|jgi:CPA1 family monovalent cation:H+ antiporter|nr:Na+/H+ antiporter [Chlorogloea purpurea SAG 13.99]MDV3002071.1 Na(+)/H(+) antiporter ApNhaP [Chroococcopsis gigantea SAG 12.99]